MIELQFKNPARESSTGKLFKSGDEKYEKSFLCAVMPVIVVSQLFGLFPVANLSSKDPKEIRFTWKSFRTFFSLAAAVGSIAFAVLMFYHQFRAGKLSPSNIVGVVFYGNCFLACVFFFKFSTNFGMFVQRWMNVESSLRESRSYESSSPWSLKRQISLSASVALSFALLEHLLSLATHIEKVRYEVEVCKWTRNSSYLENFISKHLFVVFNVIEYNHFYGFVAEYLNISATFYWSFLDVFIMIVSIGLAFNYQMINNRLKYFRGRAMPETVWLQVRVHYSEVSDLVKFVDGQMAKLIFLSCCNDAYFIIVQLMNLSSSQLFLISKIYFYVSIIFLMARTTAMFLFASTVYESSKHPLKLIRSIPNHGWYPELKRFSDQVRSETNGLSGMQFFILTRASLFALASAILTYELVLLQFNTSESDLEAWYRCDI